MYDRSLTREEWTSRRSHYLSRVGKWAEDRLCRKSRGESHPVYDFLFEYYFYRPAHLLRWSPGVGVRLADAVQSDLDWRSEFQPCDGGFVLSGEGLPSHRHEYLDWAIRFLEETGNREGRFGCFGLHEWAMVYREPEIRHKVPLRLSREETDAVVESSVLLCTHYDALRFYTPAAKPLNRYSLARADTTANEHPGCVHANMDLYKFSFVIAPYCSGEILADAFELALAARELDMRASPYDLSSMGFEPIRIETREGRESYVEAQRELARRGMPVRERLLGEYRRLRELTNRFVADIRPNFNRSG